MVLSSEGKSTRKDVTGEAVNIEDVAKASREPQTAFKPRAHVKKENRGFECSNCAVC